MPGFVLHVGATVQCFHAAPATIAPGQPRVVVGGLAVATASNQIAVAGCPFQIPIPTGTKPQPCVKVQWAMLSTRVTVMGQPVMLQIAPGPGAGLCQSIEQIPQGAPVVSSVQPRVVAT